MMAVARAMGEMMKKGWRPRRSVLFVSWDGEEQGLLGSTEWVEDLQDELRSKAAVYVNRDAGAGGLNFSGSAVHSLTPFVHELAQILSARRCSRKLYDGWLERAREQSPPKEGQPALKAPPVGALGSGSDYTAFLDQRRYPVTGHRAQRPRRRRHVSLDLRQPDVVQEIHRSGFEHSVLAAQVTGVALLRLADAEVLPFDYEAYGRQILDYVGEIEELAAKTSARRREADRFRRPQGGGGRVHGRGRDRARARRCAAVSA